MSTSVELAIVGAGPAGMAAAVAASEVGLSTVVLDEQAEPGGQIYRSIESVARTDPQRLSLLGEDYAAGLDLVRQFRAAHVDYRPDATVWQIEPDRRIFYSARGASQVVQAQRILIATGAMERPMPVPGWTLPGVMTAGAAQVLLKSAGVVPDVPAVLIGSGPLLLLLAAQLLRAGAKISAMLDTTPVGARRRAFSHLASAFAAPGYLGKGWRMLREVAAAGIPVHRAIDCVELIGDERVREVRYGRGEANQRMPAELVLLHQGVVPNANLGWALRCAHDWNDAQRCFLPRTDDSGTSSITEVAFAGDCAGIAGARSAEFAGRITALQAAHALGRLSATERDARASASHAAKARHGKIRPFLETLYRPAGAFIVPSSDDTVVCRCEEVTAGDIRAAIAQGCPGPNQMKAFVRCGMGPCQGRLCGLTVTEMIASGRGLTPSEVGYYRIRPPIKPLNLGELADLCECREGGRGKGEG